MSRRLDYDSIVDHTYNFTIMATDNGYPVSHSGSAMVRVSVTNVNDEDPVFMQAVEHILVSEDAMPNTVIHVVQAYDPDGDDVTFGFTGNTIQHEMIVHFKMDIKVSCIYSVPSVPNANKIQRLSLIHI